jgi:hypothetical protein
MDGTCLLWPSATVFVNAIHMIFLMVDEEINETRQYMYTKIFLCYSVLRALIAFKIS